MLEYDEALIVPYPTRTLRDGAIDPWTKPRYDNKRRALAEFAKTRGDFDGHAVAEAAGARSAEAAQRAKSRGYKGIFPFLARSRGEEVQAVHPRLPAAVSDRAGVSRLSRHQAPAGSAAGARRRPQHRRGERAAGRSAARVARRRSQLTPVRAAGRGAHSQGSARPRAVPVRRRARIISR